MTSPPLPKNPGIYRITHVPSGEFYVGSTNNFYLRYYCHKSTLRERRHHPQAGMSLLRKRFLRFRACNFRFEVLEQCPEDALSVREIAWMNKLKPTLNTSRYANRVQFGTPYRIPADLRISKVPKDRQPGRKAKK